MMSLNRRYFKAMLGASVLLGAVPGLWLVALEPCVGDDVVTNNEFWCRDKIC